MPECIPVILDIETLPDPRGPQPEDGEAPSNYKDPDKIAAYRAENQVKDWKKSSLDPMRNLICVVGLLVGEAQPEQFSIDKVDGDGVASVRDMERMMLSMVEARLRRVDGRKIVTFNGHGFDLPCLTRKAAAYGLTSLARSCFPGRGRQVDVMEAWACGQFPRWKGTQEEIARFLGIEVPPGLDGGKVADVWAMGGEGAVVAKNRSDLLVLKQIATRLDACGIIDLE